MASCDCCLLLGATPLYVRGHFGQVVRGELHLAPDAALCDSCWKVVGWTLRHKWVAEGKAEAKKRFNDCGED